MKGQFTLSLRDAQHFLRLRVGDDENVTHALMERLSMNDSISTVATTYNIPPCATFAELLIRTAQREILAWLDQTVHVSGSMEDTPRILLPHTSDEGHAAVLELRRTPALLVWHAEDAFARLAIHCVARTFECPSFSRSVPARNGEGIERHTWILHPNPLLRGMRSRRAIVQRPRHRRSSSASTVSSNASYSTPIAATGLTAGLLQHTISGLETPPSTDVDYTDSNDELYESDVTSRFSDSEV